jgi:acetyl-CoA carboxylase biotin carboxyl carrier protein
MDLNYIKKLVKLVSESGVDEVEIEEEGKKVRIAKHHASPAPVAPLQMAVPALEVPVHSPVPSPAAAAPSSPPPAAEAMDHEIKSPIVGTYYRAPAPDAAPFVQVGSAIQPGSVLCIVEAMKLMNEIEADVAGTIVKIMAENGQPVEYDQTLFLVEPA